MQDKRARWQCSGGDNVKPVRMIRGTAISLAVSFCALVCAAPATAAAIDTAANLPSSRSHSPAHNVQYSAAAKQAAKARTARKSAAPRAGSKPKHPSIHEAAYRARALSVAGSSSLGLKSNVALVIDQSTGETVISKNIDDVHPVASITKLMTALVILDAQVALSQRVEVSDADIDIERGSRSRLKIGTELSRDDLLKLALMASENRAAHALGRSFPGGMPVFVDAMNAKARDLGMLSTRFVDPTGLSSANVSTASDLVKLVRETHRHALIRRYSTAESHHVNIGGREIAFRNTNRLVASETWDIGLSKTGFINEAGRCLVMQAKIQGRPMVIVLLDSWGKLSRIGDANRIRKWLTSGMPRGGVNS